MVSMPPEEEETLVPVHTLFLRARLLPSIVHELFPATLSISLMSLLYHRMRSLMSFCNRNVINVLATSERLA